MGEGGIWITLYILLFISVTLIINCVAS